MADLPETAASGVHRRGAELAAALREAAGVRSDGDAGLMAWAADGIDRICGKTDRQTTAPPATVGAGAHLAEIQIVMHARGVHVFNDMGMTRDRWLDLIEFADDQARRCAP